MPGAPTLARAMERSVVSAFDPDTGDRAPVALGQAAARMLGARLVVVIVRPGGTAAQRLSRLEESSEQGRCRRGAACGAARPERSRSARSPAPSPAAGLHAVLAAERPLLAVLGSSRAGAHGSVMLGRTSRACRRRRPCPVVIAPQEHARARCIGSRSPCCRRPRAARRCSAAARARRLGRGGRCTSSWSSRARPASRRTPARSRASSRRAHRARRTCTAQAGSSLPRSPRRQPAAGVETSILVGDPVDALLRASQHVGRAPARLARVWTGPMRCASAAWLGACSTARAAPSSSSLEEIRRR